MLTPTQAVAQFQIPIVKYRAIGILQRALLKIVVTSTNDSLAATRLLALLFESNVSSILFNDVEPVTMGPPSDATIAAVTLLQTVFARLVPYYTTIKTAIGESKDFLPQPTIEIVTDYNADGSPFNILAIASLLIMTANLQDI